MRPKETERMYISWIVFNRVDIMLHLLLVLLGNLPGGVQVCMIIHVSMKKFELLMISLLRCVYADVI